MKIMKKIFGGKKKITEKRDNYSVKDVSSNKSEQSTSNLDNELEDIKLKLNDEKYDDVIMLIEKRFKQFNEEQRVEANHILGLVYFRKGEYKQSKELFQGVSIIRDDVQSWFNVITSSVLSNDYNLGEKAFQRVKEIQESKNYSEQPSMPQIIYYYAHALYDTNRYTKSLELLKELKNIYVKLQITDLTFLYLRGVPSFYNVMELAKKVFEALDTEFSKTDFYSEIHTAVDEDGKDFLLDLIKG